MQQPKDDRVGGPGRQPSQMTDARGEAPDARLVPTSADKVAGASRTTN
ncbi:hypothetical protein [Streptomyces sp. NPDC019224]